MYCASMPPPRNVYALNWYPCVVAANALVFTVTAAADTSATFKADGNALEVSYKDGSDSVVYKTNAEGLTVYSKTTSADGWSEVSYTWYK